MTVQWKLSLFQKPVPGTKLAVWSKEPNVDAVGACIGARGARVGNVVNELGGEKSILSNTARIRPIYRRGAVPADIAVRGNRPPMG